MTTPTIPAPQVSGASSRLRSVGDLFASGLSVIKHRGLTVLAIACIVWIMFAAVAAVTLSLTVDLDRLGRLYSSLLSPAGMLDVAGTQRSIDSLVGGDWLKQGWLGLGIGAIALGLVYLLCSATASIAVTDQSYAWLTSQSKMGLFRSLANGLRRAIPGAAVLFIFLLVLTVAFTACLVGGGVVTYMLADAVSDSQAVPIFASLAGGLIGTLLGVVLIFWIYTTWSVSVYAVALSRNPWSALNQSRRLTKGNRLDVFIRVVVVLLVVGVAISIVAVPLDLLLGTIPFAGASVLSLLVLLYARIMISALSPLVSNTCFTSMYLDLGGQTPTERAGDSSD